LVSVVLDTTLSVFEQNYFSFINAIATAAGVGFDQINIISITQGSVIVNMAVSSPNAAGSNAAVTAQNNIQNAISSGQSFGNMTVTTSTVTTQGGSNDSSSGLSTTAIILLAVLIPVGVIRTYLFIQSSLSSSSSHAA